MFQLTLPPPNSNGLEWRGTKYISFCLDTELEIDKKWTKHLSTQEINIYKSCVNLWDVKHFHLRNWYQNQNI